MRKKLLFLFLATNYIIAYSSARSFEVNSKTSVFSDSHLYKAKESFEKKDYSSALILYQAALNAHKPQKNQDFAPYAPLVYKQSLKDKIYSFFSKSPPSLKLNPNSKNLMDGYIYLQMGKCYVQLNKIDKAVTVFDMGVSAGGDNETGNACLFERAFCQMRGLDYQNAYQGLREYVKRNIDKDPKDIDQTRMKRAFYMASVCAWKLNRSGLNFESDMPGVTVLVKKAYSLMPKLDNRIYFKKRN